MIKKIIICFVFLLVLGAVCNQILAEEEEECTPCCQCQSCFKENMKTGESGCCSCNGECWQTYYDPCCDTDCGPPCKVCDCYNWEKMHGCDDCPCECDCKCNGGCLEIPKNPRYYDNPTYPDDPHCPVESEADSGNIYLPVKLDWDDVEGWKDGWGDCGAIENCPRNCVEHYQIKITGDLRNPATGATIPEYTETLDESEFIPPSCLLKSNSNYQWQVRACCADLSECGSWSGPWNFTTNLAPEPVWPYDPDWAGPDRAEPHWKTPTEDEFLPVHLEWCPVDEAKSYCLRFYKEGKPFCPDLISDLPCPAVIPPSKEFSIQSYFGFGLDVFTKETNYQWKVATCLSEEDVGLQCGLGCPEDKICYTFETLEFECPCCDFSQLWRFFGRTTLSAPKLIFPENGSCVNFTHNLEWGYVSGANSYRYEIYKINGGPSLLVNEPTKANLVSARDLGDKGILNIDENYAWRVQPCWDEKGTDCENDSWSNEGLLWEFTTTGATPTGLDVAEKDPNNYALIPIKLNWDDMPCAASYRYKVNGPDGIIAEGLIIGTGVPPSEISINYDSDIEHPKQGTFYSWEVWTCADKEGNICGNPDSASFTTFELDAPENRHPPDGENFYTNERYLKWKVVLGAAYYKYEIDGETNIVSLNYGSVDTWKLALGRHNWSVWACIDRDCKEMGPPSTWSFELVEGEAPAGKGGIVPCGKYTDNPNTPWNERLPCGIEHIFIMIYLIIEFVLWKLIPIALVLLVLASGVIFYFSGQLGVPDPISRVKSLWKAIGIGLAVVFLAWTGISLILGLFGYQVGIFGDWWRIF